MADQKNTDQSKQNQSSKDSTRTSMGQQSGQSPNRNSSSSNIKSDKSQMQQDDE